MNRIATATLASLALLVGCQKNNEGTANPDDASYNGFSDETPNGDGDQVAGADGGTTDGGAATGEGPAVRSSTGTRPKTRTAGPKVRNLVANKPPVKTKTKPARTPRKTDFKPSDPPELYGAAPNVVVSGGTFNVYGSGFDEDPAKNRVLIGKKAQKVLMVNGDHLIVQASGPASGPLRLTKGAGRAAARAKGGNTVTSNSMTVVEAGNGFAVPNTTAGHGLFATLYNIGAPSNELPDFNSVGAPVGFFMMDNLNVSGPFSGFKLGGETINKNFGLHFMGSLNVVEGGSYELCLTAGDGAILFLADSPFLDNDGAGDAREVCDTVEIDPGEYPLQLLYYQNDGDVALELTWAKDGGAKEPIPAEAFFPPENMDGLAQSLNQ